MTVSDDDNVDADYLKNLKENLVTLTRSIYLILFICSIFDLKAKSCLDLIV